MLKASPRGVFCYVLLGSQEVGEPSVSVYLRNLVATVASYKYQNCSHAEKEVNEMQSPSPRYAQ